MENEEIIKAVMAKVANIFKASTQVSDGTMNAEQAKRFIQTVVDQSAFLKRIGVEQMTRDKKEISTIGLAGRIMRKGSKGVDPDVVEADKGMRELSVVEFVTAFNVYFEDIEQSIEEGTFEETMTLIFTTQIGNDLADLSVNGDEDEEADDFLKINNGYLAIATTDAGIHTGNFNAESKKDIFAAMLKKMPNKWKTNKKEICFFCSSSIEEDYRDEIGERKTVRGDAALMDDVNVTYKGIEVVPVPFWPDGKIMLTKPTNLKVGIRRSVRVGKWINERKRRIEYTISGKADFEYAVSDMIVVFSKVVPQ